MKGLTTSLFLPSCRYANILTNSKIDGFQQHSFGLTSPLKNATIHFYTVCVQVTELQVTVVTFSLCNSWNISVLNSGCEPISCPQDTEQMASHGRLHNEPFIVFTSALTDAQLGVRQSFVMEAAKWNHLSLAKLATQDFQSSLSPPKEVVTSESTTSR